MGNSAGLREVLINLVLNAVEALPKGGKIAVRTFSDDGWVGLAVSDTGVGMPPEVRERALEPFFTTKGPRSTGLGLSESYGILQRHGGKLTVESAEGHGSTVTVHLPVAPRAESGGARGEPARFAASALRILVIDDDAEVREVVAEMLTAQGHTVIPASGGGEGLALLEAGQKIDLVLTDLGMPGMTGWDVARAVRARWPGLPVGMLTGWGEQIDDATPDRQMVAGVLSKPATPEGLREFVAACHATSRRI
jgi:CheY-like chemotaxis protein/anti-sigma regulatory factor (Ser/Thr protein kinase)